MTTTILGFSPVVQTTVDALQNNIGMRLAQDFKRLWLNECHDEAIALVLDQPDEVLEQIRSELRKMGIDTPADALNEHNRGVQLQLAAIVKAKGHDALTKGRVSKRRTVSLHCRKVRVDARAAA